MSRISIDVSPEEHRKLKMIAAQAGKTIKQYVLERALFDSEIDDGLEALEQYLAPRVESARHGAISHRSAMDILEAIRSQA